jgi:hypothetical protein
MMVSTFPFSEGTGKSKIQKIIDLVRENEIIFFVYFGRRRGYFINRNAIIES